MSERKSMEAAHAPDWLRIVCKGSRGLIYFLALGWLIWFARTSRLRARKAEYLLFAGLPLLVAGVLLDLWGEFFYLPLLIKRVVGEIVLTNLGTALVLGYLVLTVRELVRVSGKYRREAEIDPLTGLYNRRAFFAEAERVLREARAGRRNPAVAVLDVDNMKEVNDTWGHRGGDEALKQAALAIQKSVREGDVVARYGGDEFVVLFPDRGPRLETLRGRLKKHLKTIRFAGAEIPLSVSLGMARFPADGKDADTLFAVADARMYADKEARR